jgi:2-iminobutanoate/2-iminopropanoate deaminase
MESRMDKEIIEIPVLSEGIRNLGVPLSPVVRANGFLFVSGLPPLDPVSGQLIKGDFESQTEVVLKALKHSLESAGSSLQKVVKATAYVSNTGFFATFNRVYARYFPNLPPARTFVAVGSWPMEFDVEVECIALAS